jgi:hypothetical protein
LARISRIPEGPFNVILKGLNTRRTLALLLIALFSVSLLTPLFAADARQHLPACCLRDGEHHCSMSSQGGVDHDHGPALQARCSQYRGAASFFSGPQNATLAAPAGLQALQPCSANVALPVGSAAVSVIFGPPDSRGPPLFLE